MSIILLSLALIIVGIILGPFVSDYRETHFQFYRFLGSAVITAVGIAGFLVGIMALFA